jgi:hypothetical protein
LGTLDSLKNFLDPGKLLRGARLIEAFDEL